MDKLSQPGGLRQAEMPTDLLASLLMERSSAPSRAELHMPKVYAVMAATTLLTFATLTTGYQLLFSQQLFA
jgi:hypothetical protein